MYNDILLPTDGSEGTNSAVDHALDLAAEMGATLHVLHVVDTSVAAGVPEADAASLREILENAGTQAIDEIEELAKARGISISRAVTHGPVHSEIIEYADTLGVDVIIMGTHGRTGIDRLLLGSVTERVIQRSSRPVIVTSSTTEAQ